VLKRRLKGIKKVQEMVVVWLSEIKKRFPNFKIDGAEGQRVGYWCPNCEKPIPINNNEILWYYSSSTFVKGRHNCGKLVESIWRD